MGFIYTKAAGNEILSQGMPINTFEHPQPCCRGSGEALEEGERLSRRGSHSLDHITNQRETGCSLKDHSFNKIG